jgi:hypothetical protein
MIKSSTAIKVDVHLFLSRLPTSITMVGCYKIQQMLTKYTRPVIVDHKGLMAWICAVHSTSDDMVVLNQSNGGLPTVGHADETTSITFGYSGKCGVNAEAIITSKLPS